MKKLLAAICSILVLNVIAQTDSGDVKLLNISSISSSIGFGGVLSPSTLNDYYVFKTNVEDPSVLIDPKAFGGKSYMSNSGENVSMKLNLGFMPFSKKKDKYRNNRELRFGLGFNYGKRRSFNFYKTDYVAVDTFFSSQGNKPIYADSVYGYYYNYKENFFEFNISMAYLFKTDPSNRLYLYTGAGLEYGISMRYFLSYTELKTRSFDYYQEGDKPKDDDLYFDDKFNKEKTYMFDYSEEKTNMLNPVQFVRVYVPLGINFRFSNVNSFWKHMNIYSEINPGVEFQIAVDDKTYINPYWGVGLVGLSYKF